MKHSGHSEVVAHYQAANEEERLQTSHGKLEEARTKRIIESHLASTHRRAVDIGGGTGPYSFWLAARGLEVSLLDPVARHIELVRERAERARSGDTELASLASLASGPALAPASAPVSSRGTACPAPSRQPAWLPTCSPRA